MTLPAMVAFDGFLQGLHKPVLNIYSQVIADSWMMSDNFLLCLFQVSLQLLCAYLRVGMYV